MAGQRLAFGVWAALMAVFGCNDLGTTATGPQGFNGPGPQAPIPVRYNIIILDADTTFDQGDILLYQRASIRTETGLAVAAAVVDFRVTGGQVSPTMVPMGDDGTVAATWTIPPEVTVGNLLGCARPPGQSCNPVPLLKWNRSPPSGPAP